ncbi:UDP-4-dehydro-6-deoxy-2-acetamido-D-glucose 4-reductase [Fusobacterium necrophorum subsp. funduliforme]|uniref:UDP-4-dehydro-6-deoxy-2-acetamido-D-glucose 4-reductase n=2 Tax=Fusobacterium necrophorum TaxID=859 RepID=A0A162IZA1_9FUSO|nr:polysaccharide biosynthesis protein [Fusobacterium necrophorum subsp. funduliforme]KAB0553345.1 polysaccharide biosynthesis protein [Fusobacterium necrophorum subsp. funduliforme]KYL04749.1 UDP-4-dehydro-6-deoxy-2-acetamido-D-glucose 4-reductase [Fusobacterium necrophorum subsp. funduliforme]KYM43549.1 UDP-4-dehydro-6-deoxy-2-acetamido-D-glucose 4-reductase [Fusobacterium necrophorum subsp. funduliforme]KYM62154.1 UDP-4-dehydro-6-deoxy-2-acetamido-D-glucose 4-reductase [Fusobacterium necroph
MIDSGIVILAVILPFILKYEFDWRVNFRQLFAPLYLLLFLIGYFILHLQNYSWRYFNQQDILEIFILNIFTGILFFILAVILEFRYTKSILPVTLVFSTFMQILVRVFYSQWNYYGVREKENTREDILVYGAGEAGSILAKEFTHNKNFPYNIVGFIDDDPAKMGTYIYEIKVLANAEHLEEILRKKNIKKIIVALPSVKDIVLKKILKRIENIPEIEVKIFGMVSDILQRDIEGQIRDVQIEDLLGRKQVVIHDRAINSFLEGKVIFITGGAGSIGSELSRQIAKYNPRTLVNIDMNENNLYLLELELKRKYPYLHLVSEMCSIRDFDKLQKLFIEYKPNILFHAAAHKHVPLMEHNPEEAIKNNVFGTKNVAECVGKYGVETMVLISTDKAVNPTSFMGATKRMCELIVQESGKKYPSTKYCAVRFGNVLGSNGSVIPIFKQLIREGKNLIVTHKDINRYFMTVSEAAQLVIEAGSFGKGGEIFILDMGEPVKIYDLAKDMIRLSGAKVGIDIIGLRPGEKLYEELLYDVNKAVKTENNKIFITQVEANEIEISSYYSRLQKVAYQKDVTELKALVKEIVKEYRESV